MILGFGGGGGKKNFFLIILFFQKDTILFINISVLFVRVVTLCTGRLQGGGTKGK